MTEPRAPRSASSREHTVSFQLRRAQDASFRALSALIGGHGLRPGRYAVLQAIAEHPGLSQIELSAIVNRDKTTLTPIVQDMQHTGLLARRRDPSDARSWCLTLTDEGQALLAQLQHHAARHDARLDAILGEADKAELIRLLARLNEALG